MFTAEIINKSINSYNALVIDVKFSDGETHIVHSFTGLVSEEDMKNKIKAQADFYSKTKNAKDEISLGIIDLTPKVIDTPIPTDEEKALQAYQAMAVKVDNFKQDIKRGVIDSEFAEYVDAKDQLKQMYKSEYSGI